jgi:hypothetical protein
LPEQIELTDSFRSGSSGDAAIRTRSNLASLTELSDVASPTELRDVASPTELRDVASPTEVHARSSDLVELDAVGTQRYEISGRDRLNPWEQRPARPTALDSRRQFTVQSISTVRNTPSGQANNQDDDDDLYSMPTPPSRTTRLTASESRQFTVQSRSRVIK